MALDLNALRRLPPWALYGGAGVVAGGGYLLYRRRHAQGEGPAAAVTAPVQQFSPLATDAQQQPSIVPYYLTGNSDNGSPRERRPPRVAPVGVPGNVGTDTGTGLLPPIPPLLPPTPPAPTSPAPAPAPPVATPSVPAASQNIPADLLAKIAASGEHIISSLTDPLTGGTWWLSDKGGVFAVGGARFLGSARPYGFDDPNVRKAVAITPLGSGYRVVSDKGETYNFGG